MIKKILRAVFYTGSILIFWCLRHSKPGKAPIRLVLIENLHGRQFIVERDVMRKISTSVLSFIVAIASLTQGLAAAAIDGLVLLESSDPGVLAVTPTADGLFKVDVIGPGECQLIASGDADLGDGVKTIRTAFNYQVFDAGEEADHFELTASGFVYRETPVEETPLDTADASSVDSAA